MKLKREWFVKSIDEVEKMLGMIKADFQQMFSEIKKRKKDFGLDLEQDEGLRLDIEYSIIKC
jgi:hypothetical protein